MKTIQTIRESIFKILLPLFFLVFVSSLYAAEHSMMMLDYDVHSLIDLSERAEEYQERVEDLDEQIKECIDTIDWLSLKMERISDSGRMVTHNIGESIEKKKFNVKKLSKERQRYSELVKTILGELKRRKQTKRSSKILKPTREIFTDKQKTKEVSQDRTQDTFDKAQLFVDIEKANLSDWFEITDSSAGLKLTTTLPILFPAGSAKIADEYKSFFMKLANFLKVYDVRVMVQGYADMDPIHNNKYPSNFELGAIRAANVVHELIKNGLKPSIFNIHSPGKFRFYANGELKQKILERRAEVTVFFIG